MENKSIKINNDSKPAMKEGLINKLDIPIEMHDKRDQNIPSQFDMQSFMTDLSTFVDSAINREVKPPVNDYHGYFSLHKAEGTLLLESLKETKAMSIVVTNSGNILSDKKGLTCVEISLLITDKKGEQIVFYFNPDGTFYSSAFRLKSKKDMSSKNNETKELKQ